MSSGTGKFLLCVLGQTQDWAHTKQASPSYGKVVFETSFERSVLRTALNVALKNSWFSSLTINGREQVISITICGSRDEDLCGNERILHLH